MKLELKTDILRGSYYLCVIIMRSVSYFRFVNGFLAVLLTISAGVAVVAVRESPELKEKAHKRKKVTHYAAAWNNQWDIILPQRPDQIGQTSCGINVLCKFGVEAVKQKPSSVPAFPVTIRTQQLHRRRHQAARIPSCGKDGTPVRAHFAKTFPATARQDPPLRLKSGPRCASEKQTHPRAHEPPCGRSCIL